MPPHLSSSDRRALAERWFLAALALAARCRAVQITAPAELIEATETSYLGELVFEHNVACLGRQFRPAQPYARPVYTTPQFGRVWPDGYVSLCPVGTVAGGTCSRDARGGIADSFTTGRLLLAAPYVPHPDASTPNRPYSYGCDRVLEEAPEYGNTTMRGNICLVARSGCTFKTKWLNCVKAGASAVVIYNEAGQGDFMIGPDGEEYEPGGFGRAGVLTITNDLYRAVADYVPNVTVLLENDVVPVKPPRNCTAEVLEQITEMHSAGTYESTAGGTETQQLAWATAQTTECEAEIAAALAAQKAEDDMDALFSGSLSDTVKRERSDDPYTACIMEQPCLDTWTQITEYTVTVITLGLILLLCFIEITSMFVYGQDAGHMEPREPRLAFPCIPRCMWLCPHLDLCCLCPIFPLIYSKPQEYLNTGCFRYFLYTWPFFPRESDPEITFPARLLVTVVCVLVGLMCMMVMGNSGVKYSGVRSGSDVEVAGEAYEQLLSQGVDPEYRKWLNMFVTITVQEISKQIMRRWMGKLHDMTQGERSKWHFLPALVTTVVLDLYVLLSAYFLYSLMRDSGCTTVLDNVLIPFFGTIPFVFIMGIIGPYGYIAHNTFGTGKRITQVLAEKAEEERIAAEEAAALKAAEKGKKGKKGNKQKKLDKQASKDKELIKQKSTDSESGDDPRKLSKKNSKDGMKNSKDGMKSSRDGMKSSQDGMKKSKDGMKKSQDGMKKSKDGQNKGSKKVTKQSSKDRKKEQEEQDLGIDPTAIDPTADPPPAKGKGKKNKKLAKQASKDSSKLKKKKSKDMKSESFDNVVFDSDA